MNKISINHAFANPSGSYIVSGPEKKYIYKGYNQTVCPPAAFPLLGVKKSFLYTRKCNSRPPPL